MLPHPEAERQGPGSIAAKPPDGAFHCLRHDSDDSGLVFAKSGRGAWPFLGVGDVAAQRLAPFLTDRIGHGKRDVRSATVGDGLCLGVAQAVSVVPGLSRTGLTMAAGVFCGLDLEFSWKFSFLLAVPTLLIQAIVALAGALREGAEFYTPYLAGMALAGVCSYLALRFLRFVIRRNALGSFAYAVWAAALFAFVLYLIC